MNNNPKYLTHLRQGLTTQFKLDELISLCTDVGIDFEDLGGEGKNGKARELIAYCQRRGQLEALVALCEILRPQFPWRNPSAPILPHPTPFPPRSIWKIASSPSWARRAKSWARGLSWLGRSL